MISVSIRYVHNHTEPVADPEISKGDTPTYVVYFQNDKKIYRVILGYNSWVLLIWNISGENWYLHPPLWILHAVYDI
jgi:hypothetical protein